MPSSNSPARSGPASRARGAPNAQPKRSPGQELPSGGGGPGLAPLLLAILLLAGLAAVLVRSGVLSRGGMGLLPAEAPACPGPVNRWADQRLTQVRAQLLQEHGLYRSEGEASNAITAALNWIDDRIIDQQIGEERQQIRSSILRASRCLVQFQP